MTCLLKGGAPRLLGVTRTLQGQSKSGQVFPVDISLGHLPSELGVTLFLATFRRTRPAERSPPSSLGDQRLRVLLEQNSLGEYVDLFAEEQIDLATFYTLGEERLRSLGVTKMGAQMKIMSLINGHEQSLTAASPRAGTPARSGADSLQTESQRTPPVADDIEYFECIGKGSFGVVYRCVSFAFWLFC